ncbi:MAG: DUF58 domain-containing protein [Fimbriimonadaceae bacterium]|nr:DUF58 domain-containing protein [Fimbriimonadaceae bacterium]
MASVFLAVVAVLIQAPSLFYMGTALFALIGGCNLQAWLAVRGLRFERLAPAAVRVGDMVTVEVSLWSEHRLRRPLVTVEDNLPPKLRLRDLSPSLPVAPSYDMPVETQYQFRAMRRGRYRWSDLVVVGTDALGLVIKRKTYRTEPTEITILPRPIPVALELPVAAGWGISEAESGQTRGAGIEPRGIREYSSGDSLRHVHWRSTARTGRLLVKEFEAGTHASAAFVVQRTNGSDLFGKTKQGEPPALGSLDLMCGHLLYLAEMFVQQGARVELPGLETHPSHLIPAERMAEISEVLATVQADSDALLSGQLAAIDGALPPGSVVFVLMTLADPALPGVISRVATRGTTVVPLIYPAEAFDVRAAGQSAATTDFLRDLRTVGTQPVLMSTEAGSLG